MRKASHAGSWYTNKGSQLDRQLGEWLEAVDAASVHSPARAIIAPHAGYSYSGPTAAFAYRQVDPSRVKRVFVLGPSHHVYLEGCALTKQRTYETPLGELRIDQDVTAELSKTGKFEVMSKSVDEDEHSIEMHLPYIAKVMQGHDFTVVPVLVGNLSVAREQEYGALFAPYLADPESLFVISSDFCHWGKRFRYNYVDSSCQRIFESIEKVDRRGMQLIEEQDAPGFAAYLEQTQNTICGRHPIGVLLNAAQALAEPKSIKFLAYAQSSQCQNAGDSSVSYASASLVVGAPEA